MKKYLCLLLAGILLLSMTACKKTDAAETGNTESIQQQESSVFAPGSATVTKAVDKTTFTEPIVIPHSQGPILVNPPVFTGIPVTALHNQNAYRFVDGIATVTVNTKEGIRNLEINKAGKIVGNADYRNPVQKDSLQVKPADIGAEYYAGDGLYAYTDGTLATEGNLPYGVEYLYGLKDEKGQVVVGVQYCGIPAITFRDGYAMVRKPDGTHVMLSKTGQEYGTFTGGHSNGGGTAVAAIGESDRHVYHLYDLEGRVISDGYDAIGFVYNGIAPVEIDNKIGFIDAYGKELLEPTIAFDRVIYGKATQEFAVTFADEDAFLLPIGGELAVITLDWKQGSDYTVEQLPHSYRQVLNNEKMLYVRGQGEMFLKNYLFPQNGDNTDISFGNVTTEDGQKMLAIQQLEGTVILFESNGVVYGNRYGFRGLYDLQVNGVYNWTYTDDEGLHYGVNKLVFKDGKFADVELYRVDQKGLDQVQYTLAGKESNQSTVEAYSATLKSTEVTWVKISLDK